MSATIRLERKATINRLTLEASAMILLISGVNYTFSILKGWYTLSYKPVWSLVIPLQ